MSKLFCWFGIHRDTRTKPYMGVLNEDIGTCVVCNHCDKILEINLRLGQTIKAPIPFSIPLLIGGGIVGFLLMEAFLRFVGLK